MIIIMDKNNDNKMLTIMIIRMIIMMIIMITLPHYKGIGISSGDSTSIPHHPH